jgi:hypothetical protein
VAYALTPQVRQLLTEIDDVPYEARDLGANIVLV